MEQPPTIILGMHRSGTSILTRILEKLGLFVGWKKDENNEALFFLKFNDWILKQANATWDNPYNYKLSGEDFKNLMSNLAKKYIKSIKRMEYLGPKKFWSYNSLMELDFPWGWKDPRNSFTLDIWIKIFPDAKFVHIYRNPMDVAESLRKRTLKYKKEFKWNIKKEIKFFFLKTISYGDSQRLENIEEGIKLWEEYVSRIFEMDKKYNLNILHIKYEDLVENPVDNMQKILKKIELKYTNSQLEKAVKEITPKKKYAFLSNSNLIRIYNKTKNNEIIAKLGYHNLLR